MQVILAARVTALEGKLRAAVHVALKVIGRTHKKVPVPGTTVSQVQALSAAQLAISLGLKMVFKSTSNSLQLSCSVTITTGSLHSMR